MSIRERQVWSSIMDAYYSWNQEEYEGQMMPFRMLSKLLGRRILVEEIEAVLKKGGVARLVEIQVVQRDFYFCPLGFQERQRALFPNTRPLDRKGPA